MTTLRERMLIRRLQQRDERAFAEVMRLYQHKVFNVVFRMVGSREEAEDVAQEVFVTVFKHVDTFRGDAKLSTWLYRIATNHTRNRMKYLGRRAHNHTSELDDAAERELAEGAAERHAAAHRRARRGARGARSSSGSCRRASPRSSPSTARCWSCATWRT